jgi:charged multivesicular body protein 1
MGNKQSMEDILFNLRFTSKSMERAAKKSEKQIEVEKKKIKQAIEKGNIEGARIFSQNAIRKKSEALNYLRLASRLDAVAGRIESAIKMNQVSKTMGSVVKGMNSVLKSLDVDKITATMDKFEQQFGNLDVTTEYMEQSMSGTTSMTTPEDQVNQLMAEVADEYGLEVSSNLGGISTGKNDLNEIHRDDLSQRLAQLKTANA